MKAESKEAQAWAKKMQRARARARRKREEERAKRLERIGLGPLVKPTPTVVGLRPWRGFPDIDTLIIATVHEYAPEHSSVPAIAAFASMWARQPEGVTDANV